MKPNRSNTPNMTRVEALRLATDFFSGTRIPTEQECNDARQVLIGEHPEFKASANVIADLENLIGSAAGSPARAEAAAPMALAGCAPRVESPAEPSKEALKPSAPGTILDGYRSVQDDPVALAEFLKANDSAVRQEIRRHERTASVVVAPAPAVPSAQSVPTGLQPKQIAAEYEKVKDKPVLLARFLEANASAVLAFLNGQPA